MSLGNRTEFVAGFSQSRIEIINQAFSCCEETRGTPATSMGGLRVLRGIQVFRAVLFEQHAEQLKSRNRNDQQNTANHTKHKHPAQEMSHNPDQGIKHLYAP